VHKEIFYVPDVEIHCQFRPHQFYCLDSGRAGNFFLVGGRKKMKIKTPTSGISEQQEENSIIFPRLPLLYVFIFRPRTRARFGARVIQGIKLVWPYSFVDLHFHASSQQVRLTMKSSVCGHGLFNDDNIWIYYTATRVTQNAGESIPL
jgi:hypothetical protein